jgi:hypothetical protein
LEDPTFKIQERFTDVSSNCGQASVSTGVAFRDTDKPIIQISIQRATGETSLNEVNRCPVNFYVDGDALTFESVNLTSSNIDVIVESDRVRIKVRSGFQYDIRPAFNYKYLSTSFLQHTDTYVTLDVVVRESESFGCHIMVQVALPGGFRDGETLLGLLGTPNEDT